MLLLGLWLVLSFMILGSLTTIATVGKPRKPTSPTEAVIATILNALIIVTLAFAINKLGGL